MSATCLALGSPSLDLHSWKEGVEGAGEGHSVWLEWEERIKVPAKRNVKLVLGALATTH